MKHIDYRQLEEMVAKNVSVNSMCSILQINVNTYYNRKKSDSEFAAAVQRGIDRRGGESENTQETDMNIAVYDSMEKRGLLVDETIAPKTKATEMANGYAGKVIINLYDDKTVVIQVKGHQKNIGRILTEFAKILKTYEY